MRELKNAPRVKAPEFLDELSKTALYEAALEILSRIGMKVYHEKALSELQGAGAVLTAEGLVQISREMVEQARSTAPAAILMYDRQGAPAMELGGRNSYFGPGSDLMHTYDLESGERRESALADIVRSARLCDALPNIDFVMSNAHPKDVDPHLSYLLSFTAMLENSSKPQVITAENLGDLTAVWQIASALRGGEAVLEEKPYLVVYAEPISPLEHPVESLDKLLFCAEHALPVIYSPAPLAGATAPLTVAGHVAQGLAESLFGLVLHQLHRPGAPFLFGIGPAVLDMVTAQSSYNAPEYMLSYAATIEMAKWLDLPNWGYAGTSDAQVFDAQAGMEAGLLTYLAMSGGSNLNHDVGYLDFGLTGSLEEIVAVDEFVEMNRRLLGGIVVDEDTLALAALEEVGPGGHFMAHDHTFAHLRSGQWRPKVLNRKSREKWVEEGELDLREKCRRRALELLAKHEVAPLAAEVKAGADSVVAAFAARLSAEAR